MSPEIGFVLRNAIAPRIAGAIPRCSFPIGCENHQELVQDGITMAARMVDRLKQQNQFSKVTMGKVVDYCFSTSNQAVFHLAEAKLRPTELRGRGDEAVPTPGVRGFLNPPWPGSSPHSYGVDRH